MEILLKIALSNLLLLGQVFIIFAFIYLWKY
jgi:hypothetical protein